MMSTPVRFVVAVVAVAALGACGDDADADADDGGPPAVEAADSTDADARSSTPAATTERDDAEDPAAAAGGEPVHGGTLRYGLEAETNTGYDLATSNCAISCVMVMGSMIESLLTADTDGNFVGLLAEDFYPTPADELGEGMVELGAWDFVMRDGITFHDGTPLDADAAVTSLLHFKNGPVSGGSLAFLHSAEAIDDMTMRTYMAAPGGEPGTFPWASFPAYMASPVGWVQAPSMIEDPEGALRPAGTGPFVFESWTPNEQLSVVRNDDYWLSGEGGADLPYLDAVEFVMLADKQARDQALLAGDIDIEHTSFPDSIAALREANGIEMLESDEYGETTYLMLNHDDPVIGDLRVRQALAHCLDRELINEIRNEGIGQVADGLFSPLQDGYTEDNGFPGFDPEAGTELWDAYVAEAGDEPTIALGTTTVPYNLGTMELISAQLDQNCDIPTTVDQTEQGAFITRALVGDFQAFLWRNHGGVDTDQQFLWWWSETAPPVGEVALNFGRIRNERIDEALFTIRTQADPDVRRDAAETIDRTMADEVLNIPLVHTIWGLPHQPEVEDLTGLPLPGGGQQFPVISGRHSLAQVWLNR